MARRLQPEQPYTPLDDNLVASVLHPRANRPPDEQPPASPTQTTTPQRAEAESSVRRTFKHERMKATLRMKVSSREKREFESFVARLGAALDTTLRPSNILRAIVAVVQHAEPLLTDSIRRHPQIHRPPNDDAVAYAEFEHQLVRLIDASIRNTSPLR